MKPRDHTFIQCAQHTDAQDEEARNADELSSAQRNGDMKEHARERKCAKGGGERQGSISGKLKVRLCPICGSHLCSRIGLLLGLFTPVTLWPLIQNEFNELSLNAI